jgi:hypothetical protein
MSCQVERATMQLAGADKGNGNTVDNRAWLFLISHEMKNLRKVVSLTTKPAI